MAETAAQGRKTVTVEEAAAALGISHRHCYELCHRGELPALRLGQRWVISKEVLSDMLRAPRPAEPV